jgi:DNA-binding winged helix-turn-helix (wHTH) protein
MAPATDQPVVRFGSFRLDLPAGRLWNGDDPVTLRPRTWQVLRHLVENADRLVTKHELLDAFWGDVAVEEKAVNTCIGEIRAALGDSSRRPRFVETVQRRGFRFLASPRAEEDRPLEPGRSAFVGRCGELDGLVARLSNSGAGTPMVVVSGAAGIGKTRLVREAVELAGTRAFVGQCIEGGGLPYLPWIEMIRERLRRGATVDWSAAPDTTVAELARLIPGLQASTDHSLQPSTDPELARIRLFEAIAAFFEAASTSQPMVLVLEDLHWGDAASLHALQALLPRLAASRTRVVATLRDEDAEPGSTVRTALEALRRRGLVEFVRLGGLAAAETRTLGASLAGPSIPAYLV